MVGVILNSGRPLAVLFLSQRDNLKCCYHHGKRLVKCKKHRPATSTPGGVGRREGGRGGGEGKRGGGLNTT